jgi:hypothetical protein
MISDENNINQSSETQQVMSVGAISRVTSLAAYCLNYISIRSPIVNILRRARQYGFPIQFICLTVR